MIPTNWAARRHLRNLQREHPQIELPRTTVSIPAIEVRGELWYPAWAIPILTRRYHALWRLWMAWITGVLFGALCMAYALVHHS